MWTRSSCSIHRNRVERARPMDYFFPATVRIRNLVASVLLRYRNRHAAKTRTAISRPTSCRFKHSLRDSFQAMPDPASALSLKSFDISKSPAGANAFVSNMTLCCRHPRSEVFHLEEIHVRPLRTPNQTEATTLWYTCGLTGPAIACPST